MHACKLDRHRDVVPEEFVKMDGISSREIFKNYSNSNMSWDGTTSSLVQKSK